MKTQIKTSILGIMLLASLSLVMVSYKSAENNKPVTVENRSQPTLHKSVKVNGLNVFYREAGDRSKPTIVLLHGYPTSSHMFRNLLTDLSVRYHVLAPDYPGYGSSGSSGSGRSQFNAAS